MPSTKVKQNDIENIVTSIGTQGTDTNIPTEKAVRDAIVAGSGDRITSEASSATPTINTDNTDIHTITALAVNITSMSTNLTGTPTNFQKLSFRIKDDGTDRNISWGASFVDGEQRLPTSTTGGNTLRCIFEYDTVLSKWVCLHSMKLVVITSAAYTALVVKDVNTIYNVI